MKRKIYQVLDANEVCDANTGEAVPYWIYFDPKWSKPEKILVRNASRATMGEMTDLCDRDAENGNHHSFVGVHARLGKLLKTRSGVRNATDIMRDIAYAGGLHGMNE